MTSETRRKIARIILEYYQAERNLQNKIRIDILTGIIKLDLPDELTRDYIDQMYRLVRKAGA